ncbi:Uncharacterized damage-inducible protein DinB (forms a four-helix bundle) [Fictibacillus solisalsi]|uniref:Uncharacterized damage-inducible protein DinB (Forms a four-helix bundle) n=1 Tax=Fictibacillus solisalsi TaxID=459525 RepID=A0A1G9TXD4_9BACL|nr:DinB family protein [Fictibacillus solisalsi]SDM52342.1 Uncharacterized damage-inducible protein DinB (forms a four-helix bundle) [Fictibacillus solisalsi]
MKNHAREMYDYHAWANTRIFEKLRELPEDLYKKEMRQSIFPSLSTVMVHMYLTDQLWLNILRGEDMKEGMEASDALRREAEAETLADMHKRYTKLAEEYKDYIDHHDMEKVFTVDNPYAGQLDTTPMETIYHISTHGNYHRGHVAAMIRQTGNTSVMQDYGLYLYMKNADFVSPV